MKDEIRMKVWADAYSRMYVTIIDKICNNNVKSLIDDWKEAHAYAIDFSQQCANKTLAAFDEKWGFIQPEPPQEGEPDQPPLKVGDEFLYKKGVHRFTIQHTFHPIYCGEDGHGESIWMTYDDIIGDYDQL